MKFPPIFPKKLAISAIVVVAMFAATSMFVVFDANESSADSSFTVTDGTGKEFTFTGATQHIVTMSYGATLTVAESGQISKIVAVDKFSNDNSATDSNLKDLNAINLGSLYYASNNDYVLAKLLELQGAGSFSFSDVIVLTAYSNATVLREKLNNAGFTNVLVYLSITSYSQVVSFVNDIAHIVTGTDSSSLIKNMNAVQNTINDGLKSVAESEKAEGIFVWYKTSDGSFSIGNTGSIGVSLITAAGGVNVGYNSQSTKTTYGDKSALINLIASHPNAKIFLDSNYAKAGKSVNDFCTEVGADKSNVVPIESNWNNYCPDASTGLWTFACSLYPELFHGTVPTDNSGSAEDYTPYYISGAIAIVAVILIASFVYMRK